jgi:plasmid stabilization system protein ParE
MRVSFTQGALSDLDDILARLFSENPIAAAAVERSVLGAVERIQMWPESARAVAQWGGNVRATPLLRYPYMIFYCIAGETIEILHIRHTSRAPWKGEG